MSRERRGNQASLDLCSSPAREVMWVTMIDCLEPSSKGELRESSVYRVLSRGRKTHGRVQEARDSTLVMSPALLELPRDAFRESLLPTTQLTTAPCKQIFSTLLIMSHPTVVQESKYRLWIFMPYVYSASCSHFRSCASSTSGGNSATPIGLCS